MANHLNSQSAEVKYISDTGVECMTCKKDTMRVREELRGSAHLTQYLECPNCGGAYPRLVSFDRQTVLHDPFNDIHQSRR
jgi:DNA-directed RNA polymerase subunit RPC12/RpoP